MAPRLALLITIVLSLSMVLVHGADHVTGWFAGDGTQYTLSHPTNGNCNFMAFPPAAVTNYAALNAVQFKSTANCGRCAEVSCVDAKCQGAAKRTEIVYIVDQCPECVRGDLDLSPDVFKSITGHQSDRVEIQWKFVDCPVAGPIQFCLKNGSNPFWTAVQPANTLVGIQSMEVNGQPTTIVDSAYYFLRDGKSATQTDLTSLQLKLTSVNGEVIEETVSLANGGCVESKFQFTKGRAADSEADYVDDSTPRPATAAPVPTPVPTTAAEELRSAESGSEDPGLRGSVKAPEDEDVVVNPTQAPTPTPTSTPTQPPTATANATPVIRQVTARADDLSHATSPALLVLLVLACTCIVVLVVLAVVVKHKRRLKRESEAKHDVEHVSQLPQLIIKQNSYEELTTPSRRADIAYL